ncbi:uncharacterized protein LOC132619909 [Lycium barbarum]|uniref:uncharacterized protein LOC132619909 n=1 Tax=Lycium barbarum TaxID=112863 RepID=UPI00293F0ADB|nr:uncharacterized protein LOC132619909 [Lycium barbarum]
MAFLGDKVVAVIRVGGPTKGTRFRPLSFNTPKPLFPLAGQPMVHHPISACKRIPNLSRIFLVGFYEERAFALYASSVSRELNIPVRYLREDKPHGSAGGISYFRTQIMEDLPSYIFLLNCNVCCNFPLPEMFDAHIRYGGMGILLVSKVSAESASQFGELVADPVTKELLHYTEKLETFVSDLINCGVYVFTSEIFSAIQDVSTHRNDRGKIYPILFPYPETAALPFKVGVRSAYNLPSPDPTWWDYTGLVVIVVVVVVDLCLVFLNFSYSASFFQPACNRVIQVSIDFLTFKQLYQSLPKDFVRLDQDILSPLAGKKKLYTYETMDFWEQIKTPGMSLKCSALYLAQFRNTTPHLLASGDGTSNATIVGDVYIHPSAKVYSTAKIGPNVSISANVRVAAGARLVSCIILDNVEIKENAVIMHAIVGWKSSIGKWSRVQAEGDYNSKLGITILGEAVTVEDEVVVINSIVLPNKTLNVSVQEEIIL